MDGRQFFPGFSGNIQQVPEFNAAGYGRGYGVPGSYFMPGSNAGIGFSDLSCASRARLIYAD